MVIEEIGPYLKDLKKISNKKFIHKLNFSFRLFSKFCAEKKTGFYFG